MDDDHVESNRTLSAWYYSKCGDASQCDDVECDVAVCNSRRFQETCGNYMLPNLYWTN